MQAASRLPAGGAQPPPGQQQPQQQQQQQGETGGGGKSAEGDVGHQLNLEAVRLRVQELQQTIQRMLATFQDNYHLKWTDVLGQFAMVNTQMFRLVEDLKPILRLFVIHPSHVTVENATILPIMLSSKLLPEMEAEETAQRDQLLATLSALPPQAQAERLQRQIEGIKQACDRAEKVVMDARKLYGIGGRLGPASAGPQVDKAHLARLLEQEKILRTALMTGEGLRPPPGQQQKQAALTRHVAKPESVGASAASPIDTANSPSLDAGLHSRRPQGGRAPVPAPPSTIGKPPVGAAASPGLPASTPPLSGTGLQNPKYSSPRQSLNPGSPAMLPPQASLGPSAIRAASPLPGVSYAPSPPLPVAWSPGQSLNAGSPGQQQQQQIPMPSLQQQQARQRAAQQQRQQQQQQQQRRTLP